MALHLYVFCENVCVSPYKKIDTFPLNCNFARFQCTKSKRRKKKYVWNVIETETNFLPYYNSAYINFFVMLN